MRPKFMVYDGDALMGLRYDQENEILLVGFPCKYRKEIEKRLVSCFGLEVGNALSDDGKGWRCRLEFEITSARFTRGVKRLEVQGCGVVPTTGFRRLMG